MDNTIGNFFSKFLPCFGYSTGQQHSTGKFSFKGKEEALRNMGLSEEEINKLIKPKPIKNKNPIKIIM